MNAPDDAGPWGPKVDPRTRPLEAEDPLELVAEMADGDPQQMLRCLLEEFLGMGWQPAALAALFHDPAYPLLVDLGRRLGHDAVARCLEELVLRGAQLQVIEQIADDEQEEALDDEPPRLLQILSREAAAGRGTTDRDGM